jgi:hypothetical protein
LGFSDDSDSSSAFVALLFGFASPVLACAFGSLDATTSGAGMMNGRILTFFGTSSALAS